MTNPLPSYTRSPFDEAVAVVVAVAVVDVDVVVTVVNTVSALQLFC